MSDGATDHYKMALVAYNSPEQFVLHITYIDGSGTVTERVVSPMSMQPAGILSFCLGRQDLRMFKYQRILRMRLQVASEILCPESIKELVSHRRRRRQ